VPVPSISGRAGEGLLNRARRTPGLSDLLRTPLYLVVLGEIGSGGGLLPETKEQAIRRFIERQEQRSEQRSILSRSCETAIKNIFAPPPAG
jgi:hypothetical protein